MIHGAKCGWAVTVIAVAVVGGCDEDQSSAVTAADGGHGRIDASTSSDAAAGDAAQDATSSKPASDASSDSDAATDAASEAGSCGVPGRLCTTTWPLHAGLSGICSKAGACGCTFDSDCKASYGATFVCSHDNRPCAMCGGSWCEVPTSVCTADGGKCVTSWTMHLGLPGVCGAGNCGCATNADCVTTYGVGYTCAIDTSTCPACGGSWCVPP